MFTTGEIVGLAEWIIDGTCLVNCCISKNVPNAIDQIKSVKEQKNVRRKVRKWIWLDTDHLIFGFLAIYVNRKESCKS